MAEIKLTGNKRVKTLKADFKEAFGSSLRVYKGQHFADDEATLASIRAEGKKAADITIKGTMIVKEFEELVTAEYGIKVQVANADNSELADNAATLVQAGKAKK